MKFDVLVCCEPEDFSKLPFCLSGIEKNVAGFDGLYVVAPVRPPAVGSPPFTWIPDEQALRATPQRWRFQPDWIYRQFIKLFQAATPNDYYVTIDSDVVIRKPLTFFDDHGHPVWHLGRDQLHKPYFRFQQKLFGFGREYKRSFINGVNFFCRPIITEMLARLGANLDEFIEASYRLVSNSSYPAGPEIYGNYVYRYHPWLYTMRECKTEFSDRPQTQPDLQWTPTEIEAEIAALSLNDPDIVMLVSWREQSTEHGASRKSPWYSQAAGLFSPALPGSRPWKKHHPFVSSVDPAKRDFPHVSLERALALLKERNGSTIVEIGSMRHPLTHPLEDHAHPCCCDGHSTLVLASSGATLFSVDYDPDCTKIAGQALREHNFRNATALNGDGIAFLEKFDRPIDLLYLDAWDANTPDSAAQHLCAYFTARPNLHDKSIILIDDTDVSLEGRELRRNTTGIGGKATLVVPHAENDGYRVVLKGRQVLLARP